MLPFYSRKSIKIWTVSLVALCILCLASASSEDRSNENLMPNSIDGGKIVADLGFRPVPNGFSFDNYANGDIYSGATYQNLMPEDLKRLLIMDICAEINEHGTCSVSPVWTYWRELANDVMDGGHCYGMAVLSLMFYEGLKNPKEFGANSTFDLKIDGNKPLQREIAYWFSTQLLDPTRNSTIDGTPGELLNRLIASLRSENRTDKYIMVLEGNDGAHAVVPFAVEDMGNDEYNILVYDTNHANETNKIFVNLSDVYQDKKIEFWRYLHFDKNYLNAEAYAGTSLDNNMRLIPLNASLAPQSCSYCSGFVKNCLIWAEGRVQILITDERSRRLGILNGKKLNEIPGSDIMEPMTGEENDTSPIYIMPFLERFNVTLQGIDSKENVTTNLTMISPRFFAVVSDLQLRPGENSTFCFNPSNSFGREEPALTYWPSGPASPLVAMGIEENETAYMFMLDGFRLEKSIALNMMLMPDRGMFSFQPLRTGDYLDLLSNDHMDKGEMNIFDVYVAHYNETRMEVFGHEGLKIEPDSIAILDYANWPGNGHNMSMNMTGSLGLTEKRIWLSDMTDQLPGN